MASSDDFVKFLEHNSNDILKHIEIDIKYGIFTLRFSKLGRINDNTYNLTLFYSKYGELDYYCRFIKYVNMGDKINIDKIRLRYLIVINDFDEHKNIIEFLSNFGPIIKDRAHMCLFNCGDIKISNYQGDGGFVISYKFSYSHIRNVNDIIKYYPEIYKYQIIKDQKIVLQ